MYDVRIIQIIVIVTCALRASTKTDEKDNLQLSKIFCTPKDFSRVNFDHFEILERNNFDPPPTGISSKDESTKQQPKSFANAQVMLRIGGDDIKGKNSIECPQKVMSKIGQPYPIEHAAGIHHRENQIRSSANPFLPYSFVPQINQYSPISPYLTVAPLAPPFVFPGYMINSPEFAAPYGYNGMPSTSNNEYECENFLENTNRERTIANIINVNHPKILHSTDLKNDIVRGTRSQHTDINNTDAVVEKKDLTKDSKDPPIVIFQADRREGIQNTAFKINSLPKETPDGPNKERPFAYKPFSGFNERAPIRPSYNMLYSHNIMLDPLSREVLGDIRPIADDNLFKPSENVGTINEIVSIPKIREDIPIYESESPFSTFNEDEVYVPLTREDLYGTRKGKLISVISDKDKKTQFFSHYTLSQIDPLDNKEKCIDSQPTKQDGVLFMENKDKKKPTLPDVKLTLPEPPICEGSTLHIPALKQELPFTNFPMKDIPLSKQSIKESPIKIKPCKETSIEFQSYREAPISIPTLKQELPFTNSAMKDIPLCKHSIKENPIEIKPCKETSIEFPSYREAPISIPTHEKIPFDKEIPVLIPIHTKLPSHSDDNFVPCIEPLIDEKSHNSITVCEETPIPLSSNTKTTIVPHSSKKISIFPSSFEETVSEGELFENYNSNEASICIPPCTQNQTPMSVSANEETPILIPSHKEASIETTASKEIHQSIINHVCKDSTIPIQPCTGDSLTEKTPVSKSVHKKTPISSATKKNVAKKIPISVHPDRKIPVSTKAHSKTPSKATSSKESSTYIPPRTEQPPGVCDNTPKCDKLPIDLTCTENNPPVTVANDEFISINVAEKTHPSISSMKEIPISKAACEENIIESSSSKETPMSISAHQKDCLPNDLQPLEFCDDSVPIHEEILNIIAAYIPIFKEAMKEECNESNDSSSLENPISISTDGEFTFSSCEELPPCNGDNIKPECEETSIDIAVSEETPISISAIKETAKKKAPIDIEGYKETPMYIGAHKKESPISKSAVKETPISITTIKKEAPISTTTIKKEAPIYIPPIIKEAPIYIPDKETSIESPVFEENPISMLTDKEEQFHKTSCTELPPSNCDNIKPIYEEPSIEVASFKEAPILISSSEEASFSNDACKESTIYTPSCTQAPPCDYYNIKPLYEETSIAPISIEEIPISIIATKETPINIDACKELPISITAIKEQPISITSVKKESPIHISSIKETPISITAHQESPIAPISCTELPSCNYENIKHIYEETPIDISAHKECLISIGTIDETPISNEAPIPSCLIKGILTYEETPIELSVHKEAPTKISCTELPPCSYDDIKPIFEEAPIKIAAFKECPVSIVAIEEPISITATKEEPIHISSVKETPISIPVFRETPIELSVHPDVPLLISSKEEPCPNDASSYNCDHVIPVYEETPITVVDYKETPISKAPKKETPIFITAAKEAPIQISPMEETPIFIPAHEQTSIESSMPTEVPIPKSCKELLPCSFDNIIPLNKETPIDTAVYEECPISIESIEDTSISISATNEAFIDVGSSKETSISIVANKETPISIPSIKKEAPIHIPPIIKETPISIQANKEAPIELSMDKETPISKICTELPPSSCENIKPIYEEPAIDTAAYEGCPIYIEAIEETPMSVGATKEAPSDIGACEEIPIFIQAHKESPIECSVDKETPIPISCKELPLSSCESIKPIYEEPAIDTAVCEERPIPIEAIEEPPISISATKEAPIDIGVYNETSISIAANKETPISIPSIKKEAPIHIPSIIKAHKETPISIICTESPPSSCENIKPIYEEIPIDITYKECPISIVAIEDTPISLTGTKETEIDLGAPIAISSDEVVPFSNIACQESSIHTPSCTELPIHNNCDNFIPIYDGTLIDVATYKEPIYIYSIIEETPISIPVFKDSPLLISNKEEPCLDNTHIGSAASSCNSDKIEAVYEGIPISVVNFEETSITVAPKKETPISIPYIKKETPISITAFKESPIELTVHKDVPLFILNKEEPFSDDAYKRSSASLCNFDNIKPVYEEAPIAVVDCKNTPISAAPKKETPISIPPRKDHIQPVCEQTTMDAAAYEEKVKPLSITTSKETPSNISPMKEATCKEEAPCELSYKKQVPFANNDYKESITCLEPLHLNCDNIVSVYEETPITVAACEETPISIVAAKEAPITITAKKETPIFISSIKEAPISIPAYKETPIESIVCEETPICMTAVVFEESHIPLTIHKETCNEVPLSISPIHPISCVDTGACQETPICVPVETDSNFYFYPVCNGENEEYHPPQHYDHSCSPSNNQEDNLLVKKELSSHICSEEKKENSICNTCQYPLEKHTCEESPTHSPGFTYPEKPVVVTLSTIEQKTVPSHSHNEMCYVDIVPEIECKKIEEWLNNSLVPYDCKEYGRKFLVSYPISQGIAPEIPKCNFFSGTPAYNKKLSNINCPCCQLKGFCDCINCQCGRSTACPYGKRFTTDVDSLFEIVPSEKWTPTCSQSMGYKIKSSPQSSSHSKLSLPLPYSTGYSTSYKSTSLSGYLKVGEEVVYNGLTTVSGGGFYTDSHNHVYYKQPCIKQIVSKPFPNDVELQVNCYQPPKIFSFIPNHAAVSNYKKPCYVPTDNNIYCSKLHPYSDKIISQRKYVASDDTVMVHKDTACSYT